MDLFVFEDQSLTSTQRLGILHLLFVSLSASVPCIRRLDAHVRYAEISQVQCREKGHFHASQSIEMLNHSHHSLPHLHSPTALGCGGLAQAPGMRVLSAAVA